MQSLENEKDEQIFQGEAYERLNALDSGLQNAIGFLSDLNRAFAESCFTPQEQFGTFTRPLLERHSYIYSIAFRRPEGAKTPPCKGNPIRTASLRRSQLMEPAFIERAAAESANRGGAVPEISGYAAASLDTSVIRKQELALSRSGSDGRPAATTLFRLQPHKESPPFFSVVATAFPQASGSEASSGASRETIAYTVAVLNARKLAEEIFRQYALLDKKGIEITLSERGDGGEEDIIFRHPSFAGGASARGDMPLSPVEETAPGELRVVRTYDVGGSQWQMVVSSKRSPSGISSPGPWMALISASLISLLLAGYLQALATRAKMLEVTNQAQQTDIETLKAMERRLRDAQGEMRELAAYQDRAVENERKRIAREIHDDLGQNLLALRIDVTLLDQRTAAANAEFNAEVKALLAQVDVTIKSIRTIINHLRPTALDHGLYAAIEWLVKQMGDRSNVAFKLMVEDKKFCASFDDEQATAIFRITQEALSNVLRHANARHAEIRLGKKDCVLHVVISDDGVGSYPGNQRKPRSYGLIGIRERVRAMGGEFTMESMPNHGTTLSFSVPCRHLQKEAGDGQLCCKA
jgi:signal transduction histidine kinase